MRRKADGFARGYRINTRGYVEYTRKDHPHYGKTAHVAAIEEQIGRKLEGNECVHHIDGDKLNNDLSNLRLMTQKDHARLHRMQEKAAGIVRVRNSKGQFTGEIL